MYHCLIFRLFEYIHFILTVLCFSKKNTGEAYVPPVLSFSVFVLHFAKERFLECLALLDSIVQEDERCDVADAYNNECKSSEVEALNDEVSEAYTDSSADSLCPACNRVITSLSDELRTITECHQVSAGSHHDWECSLYVHAQNGYQSQDTSSASISDI